MADLVRNQPVVLTAATPSVETAPITIHPQTAVLVLTLRRPTTVDVIPWGETASLHVAIVLMVDGIEHRATGQATGGIRVGPGGVESPIYRLRYVPSYGFFGARGGVPKRLGERAVATFTAQATVALVSGLSATTALSLMTSEAPAPAVAFRSSVAFDTATDVEDLTGDGTISLTHTAGGTSDRAVFAGVGSGVSSGVRHSNPPTYGGSSMTERWDVFDTMTTGLGNAGYSLAIGASLTGAQTVSNTLSDTGSLYWHTLAVLSLTGVHQTTSVGTPEFTAEDTADTTSPISLTVGSVGADDLVVDHLTTFSNIPTIGADQTQRLDETEFGIHMRVSTQPGATGGVMSWTATGLLGALYGAIAFKPTAVSVSLPPSRSAIGHVLVR
jgi:hypothetical protein